MRNGFVFKKNFSRGHYFRHARFIVRAEKGFSVRHDEFFALIIQKFGRFFYGYNRSVSEDYIVSVANNLFRIDVLAAYGGRSVDVRNKTKVIQPLFRSGNNRRNVTVFILFDNRAHSGEFVAQNF